MLYCAETPGSDMCYLMMLLFYSSDGKRKELCIVYIN